MTTAQCATCGRPSPHATLCPHCQDALRADLRAIAALFPDVEIRLTRQARYTGPNDGGRAASTPLVFDPVASEVLYVARNTLDAWARAVQPEPDPHPRASTLGILADVPPSIPARAGWLAGHAAVLAAHPDGGQAADEIADVARRMHAACDRPPDLVYAGPCDQCGHDVYAHPGRDTARCRRCGIDYPVHERRAAMTRAMADQHATASRIVLYARLLGRTTTVSAIHNYASRHRLKAVDRTVHGTLYRVGDVLDILAGRPVHGPTCARRCEHSSCANARATATTGPDMAASA